MSFQLYIFSMVWFSLPHNIFQTCMPLKFPPSSHYPPLILPISFTICFSSLSLMCLIVINLSVTSQAITFFFLYTVSFSNFHISLITSINYYVILSFDFTLGIQLIVWNLYFPLALHFFPLAVHVQHFVNIVFHWLYQRNYNLFAMLSFQ